MNYRILVCMAMREEERGELTGLGADVIFTGLGKVNATYALMKALRERNTGQGQDVNLVVNFGTAGSYTFDAKELVECTRFVQRDMDVTPLGFPMGKTPFEEEIPEVLEFSRKWDMSVMRDGSCGTGDNFAVAQPKVKCDIVDMEAYAFAKVCRLENIPFACAKYITDGADGDAHLDWKAHLPGAAESFGKAYLKLLEKINASGVRPESL